MIRRFLSRRRRGAMAMVALAALVPVSAMLAANANTSQMIDDRRQVQDASDAISTLHGTWTARALNIISMNNVTSAQLMTVAVGSEALFFTNQEIIIGSMRAMSGIRSHRDQHCIFMTPPPVSALESSWVKLCRAWHALFRLPAVLAMARALDSNSDFKPLHGIDTATKALEAIDGMNKALAARHPRAMREIIEGYHSDLEITAHHFADPCLGDLVDQCRRTNSSDGMSLPISPADFFARTKLLAVMEAGTTLTDTTFEVRGFSDGGPLRAGGSSDRPIVNEHINNITEIGNTLYEFDWFYSTRVGHMPRHPLQGPGSGNFAVFDPVKTDPYQGDPFEDRSRDFYDVLVPPLELMRNILEPIMLIVRNVWPLGFDQHDTYLFKDTQGRTSDNSFFQNYNLALGTILMGDVRGDLPIGVSIIPPRLVQASPVPETFRLIDIDPSPLNFAPPIDARSMPDAFHVLGYAYKDAAPRLSEKVIPTLIDGHTGYGQTGVFTPDGATLFTQNWQRELMPATRMDDVRDAARSLGRQATASFDPLAEHLSEVGSTSSWRRVHAH